MKITENLAIFQAIDLMLVDALVSANDYLQIASHIEDPSQYWKVGYLYIFVFLIIAYCTIEIFVFAGVVRRHYNQDH